MPKRKITESLWKALVEAYEHWDPAGADTIEVVVAPFGISKQAFYAEARRRGYTLKSHTATAGDMVEAKLQAALLETLLTARLRIRVLESELAKHGISPPPQD